MVRSKSLVRGALVAVAAWSATACSAGTQTDDASADAALSPAKVELDRRGAGKLDIAAGRDTLSVHLLLRRGPLRPLTWQGDPAVDGAYEGDVMMADAQGRAVVVELGGHAPIDPAWKDRIERSQGAIDPALRRKQLLLAAEVAAMLATDPRLDRETQLLAAGLATSVRATLDGFGEGPQVIASAEPSAAGAGEGSDAGARRVPGAPQLGQTRQALQATYTHQVYVRGAACCWPGYQHSSTRLRIFDNRGGLVADLKTRNHGRWVDDPSMRTAVGCPRAWSGRTNQTPLYVPYFTSDTFADGKGGGCQTAYGILSGEHVCNDDSYAQYSNVKNNPFLLQAYATCSDTSLRGTAPTCF